MKVKYCNYFGSIFRQIKGQKIEKYSNGCWSEYKFYPPKTLEDFKKSIHGWTYRKITRKELFLRLL